jgi:F0F1-type ATP synthase assembly protein I
MSDETNRRFERLEDELDSLREKNGEEHEAIRTRLRDLEIKGQSRERKSDLAVRVATGLCISIIGGVVVALLAGGTVHP